MTARGPAPSTRLYNPQATEDAFVGDWFRTGDLFRSDERGLYWLVGRIKDMIRRSSENIAAREVEAVIRELPEVEDVAAVPVRDQDRGEEGKIFIQLKSGMSREHLTVERILVHARSRLAVFKVPRYIGYIDTFPRTASNKIVKPALIAASSDLRLGCYDALDKIWR
jgi:acyl-CoA synthetase (AMP-forming)/AMP-acid ligase II